MTEKIEWRPMDTAPRDGTEVLLLTSHEGVKIRYWYGDDEGEWWQSDDAGYICHEENAVAWMPIPPIPKRVR